MEGRTGLAAALSVSTVNLSYTILLYFIYITFSVIFWINIGLLVSDMQLYEETRNYNQ